VVLNCDDVGWILVGLWVGWAVWHAMCMQQEACHGVCLRVCARGGYAVCQHDGSVCVCVCLRQGCKGG
jgi:hypothetical protein